MLGQLSCRPALCVRKLVHVDSHVDATVRSGAPWEEITTSAGGSRHGTTPSYKRCGSCRRMGCGSACSLRLAALGACDMMAHLYRARDHINVNYLHLHLHLWKQPLAREPRCHRGCRPEAHVQKRVREQPRTSQAHWKRLAAAKVPDVWLHTIG